MESDSVILGLLGRYAGTGGVPEGFMRTDVLIIMGVLALLEVIADKIPVVDSIWDVPSTVIRPVAGAVIGALIAGAQGDLLTISLSKAGIRLAINTSPEPASNVAASVAGDVGVVSVTTLAVLLPVVAAGIALVLLVIMMWLAWVLMSRIKRGWEWLKTRWGNGDAG